ncbi:hypothetical protein EDD18DRAFT_1346684 [Armillaria luteobubalina]|uniref:Zn(2)-C6 fungal-type domain-containing protein n=1 Tax=Armillaria luteobubalina TaxID=153913 RepID=A0AA39QHT4_9AGAR|nr:hypothetical protein EDD18DRAFT_1346684 [Armillaria luteobubalina]
MSYFSPSFSDVNVGLLQPIQDGCDLWYQQNASFHEYGQHQRLTQQVNDQYSIDPYRQQESYNSYDRMASNLLQNHLPPSHVQPPREQSQKTPQEKKIRRPGACTRCKRVKMKCDFAPGEQTCQRCKLKGYHCIVESRKPKVYECDRLLTEIQQKDAVIETLLKQRYNPYSATPHSIDEYLESVPPSDRNNPNILAWLGHLKASVQTDRGSLKETSEEGPGQLLHDQQCNLFTHSMVQEHKEMSTASAPTKVSDVPAEFRPECEALQITPIVPGFRLGNSMRLKSAEILVLGIVTLEDAEKLFGIFYTYIHPFVALLDPVLFTPKSTLARCPVLFSVICAIASRYHPPKSNIYPIAMHFAKRSAANALILDGMKSVELCQAYILMSIYPAPERSWDRDQTWLYIGLAVRCVHRDMFFLLFQLRHSIATALRLDQTPKLDSVTESKEREYLNRVRVWQFCFLLDQGIAIQNGKPSSWMMKEHTIIRHSKEWYRQSFYNLHYDVFLCGCNELLCIVARFHEEALRSRSGLIISERGNLLDAIMRYDAEIGIFKEEWQKTFKVGGAHRETMVRRRDLPFYVAYFRLVMFSSGFHQVFHAGIETWYDYFFTKCFEYAKSVIRCMNEDLAPGGVMRYAPDRQFICVAFAVAFLFKLLRPEFSSLLDKVDKDESIQLIGILINKFSSPSIAVDDQHTPKVYARFFATVLDKYQHDGEGAAFEGSQRVIPENVGESRSVTGETSKESGDNWRKSHLTRGYDSAVLTYWTEAPHMTHSWPTQFGSDAEQLHIMSGNQNINGNDWAEAPPGNIEDQMFASMSQIFENPEWLQGFLMPG